MTERSISEEQSQPPTAEEQVAMGAFLQALRMARVNDQIGKMLGATAEQLDKAKAQIDALKSENARLRAPKKPTAAPASEESDA